MIQRVFADLRGQVARRVYRRVEHDRPALPVFGQAGGVIAAQRGADNGQVALGLHAAGLHGLFDEVIGQRHGAPRAGGQLGAYPLAGQAALLHGLRHERGLVRLGR